MRWGLYSPPQPQIVLPSLRRLTPAPIHPLDLSERGAFSPPQDLLSLEHIAYRSPAEPPGRFLAQRFLVPLFLASKNH